MTLVEILVACVILSIGLLAFVTASQASRLQLAKSSYYTLAAQAADSEIKDCEGSGFSGLTAGKTTYNVTGIPGGKMTVVIGPLDGNASNTNIVEVDVTVSWPSPPGATTGGGALVYSTLVVQTP